MNKKAPRVLRGHVLDLAACDIDALFEVMVKYRVSLRLHNDNFMGDF